MLFVDAKQGTEDEFKKLYHAAMPAFRSEAGGGCAFSLPERRCLRKGRGFAVMPDFVCRKEVANKTVKVAWEGSPHVENMLHFGKRKKPIYANEIRQLEQLLMDNWF